MLGQEKLYSPGARVLIRDAEWRVKTVDAVKQGGYLLTCTGLSEIVRGKEAKFFSIYEKDIQVLKPEETHLVQDDSPGFSKSKLWLEALFRSTPQTDSSKIIVSSHSAMDPLPYQFNPALQALSQPRPRILIADAVGIGKTLEAGILTSELIARGRGRRILVLATKAMLDQFQKEFWTRFSIPLVKLDSAGIQRIYTRIPTNHNPFLYYDRTIISIDTLKQDSQYRDWLEKAYWDIIIIDEAHNVAVRGNRSQRARLAQTLATRSDAMIMLSATPHDGRSESFASLLNILDPTAIANEKDYSAADFADKGLVIRRFKHHIRDQVQKSFPDREIKTIEATASPAENQVYQLLSTLRFHTLDKKNTSGAQLFSTTLTKAMFSSPDACASIIRNRLGKLDRTIRKAGGTDVKHLHEDVEKLQDLLNLVEGITPEKFSKLDRLVNMLMTRKQGALGLDSSSTEDFLDWNPKDTHDRLVIFTESIPTLRYLEKELPKRIGLKDRQYATLDGGMKDTEIMRVVSEFGSAESPVRLLLCSDVASEGINLHHFAHRMIHFDMPWSLMTFQQRNGRIDRYGQERRPQIRYMQTIADDEQARFDARILKRLQEKDEQAQKNLDDPAEFLMSQEEQENLTYAKVEGREDVDAQPEAFDPFAYFFGEGSTSGEKSEGQTEGDVQDVSMISPVLSEVEYREHLSEGISLYRNDMDFAGAALRYINTKANLSSNELDISEHQILLQAPPDLRIRMAQLPAEVLPEGGRFNLTDDTGVIQEEIQHARYTGREWPAVQLLWPLHPVMQWLTDRSLGVFGRHTAPVLWLPALPSDERWALIQGGYPNRRGYIPIHQWIAVCEKSGQMSVHTLDEAIKALGLTGDLANRGTAFGTDQFRDFVRKAVDIAKQQLAVEKGQFDANAKALLENRLAALDELKGRHEQQIEFDFRDMQANLRKTREEARRKLMDKNFNDAKQYIRDTAVTEDEPYLQLAAVFAGIPTSN